MASNGEPVNLPPRSFPLGFISSAPPSPTLRHSSDNIGTLIPNKVFIGGLAEKTLEKDIRDVFGKMLPEIEIKEVKIITDRAPNPNTKSNEPRRYAFVELQNEKDESKIEEDVKRVVAYFAPNGGKDLELHSRRLNVGHAFKKIAKSSGLIDIAQGHPFSMDSLQLQILFLQQKQQQLAMAAAAAQNQGFYWPYGIYGQMPSTPSSPMIAYPQTAPSSPGPHRSYSQPMSSMSQDSSRGASSMNASPTMYIQSIQDARFAGMAPDRMQQSRGEGVNVYRTCNGFVDSDSLRTQQLHASYGHH